MSTMFLIIILTIFLYWLVYSGQKRLDEVGRGIKAKRLADGCLRDAKGRFCSFMTIAEMKRRIK